MTLKEAQETVDRWIKTYGVRYFSELTNLACLTEEVGELARIMARRYGDQSFKAGESTDLADELADVLWVLLCLANQTGVDLTEAFRRNLEKKTRRDATRHKSNAKLTAQRKRAKPKPLKQRNNYNTIPLCQNTNTATAVTNMATNTTMRPTTMPST